MARLAGMARYGDALLAAVLSVLVAIELLGLGSPGSLGTWADSPETAAALLVALAFTASLAVRRRLPLMCLLLAVVAAVALPVSPFEASLALTAAMAVATYSAGAHTRGPAAVSGAVGVIVLGASIVGASIVLREPAAATDDLVDLLLPLGPWLAGIAIRVRRDREDLLEQRAAALEREREAQERAAVAAERGRIARELHDVVAHAISIVVLQARGARRVLADDPAATSAALDSIEETASNALAEMRRVVHVLRDEGEAGELAPQPSIGQLDVLVEQVRDAGLDVDVAVEGEPVDLPAGVSLSGYRIVQEALTNALRHAGPGVTRVVIRYLPGEVELEIEDRGGGPPPVDPKGLGLLGMQERVALLGGSLDAGPTDGGGYRVRARLPLEPVGS